MHKSREFEIWIRDRLVEYVEADFRKHLKIGPDDPINYYYNECITPDGKCKDKHKDVWCGGMTIRQFIRRCISRKSWKSIHATSALNKAGIVDIDSDGDVDISEYNSVWIGDTNWAGIGCGDDEFVWLWESVVDKRAKEDPCPTLDADPDEV